MHSRRLLASAPTTPLFPADHQPSKLVKMMPLHQMPAANPEPERLDETSVKTIQPKVNNKVDPAMPVHTYTVARSPLRPSPARTLPIAQRQPRKPNNVLPLLPSLYSPPQINDMPQSEPAGQEQMASVQQARCLDPP